MPWSLTSPVPTGWEGPLIMSRVHRGPRRHALAKYLSAQPLVISRTMLRTCCHSQQQSPTCCVTQGHLPDLSELSPSGLHSRVPPLPLPAFPRRSASRRALPLPLLLFSGPSGLSKTCSAASQNLFSFVFGNHL